ncbi:MAG: DUF3320 domain-containing protein [Leptolyngbya sp. PLA3]|nr:MAG: DUF3320 domain-containing protein [Cyanobacteria bacterium CYA]MCE7969115.1 DUF3320 domain-containing protein [Leptolyngbya sp. PL-A3]
MSIAIDLEYCERVNLAMQQHGVPLIDAILLTNTGEQACDELHVSLTLENGEASWSCRLLRIEPGHMHRLVPEQLQVSSASLSARTETERTSITVTVEWNGRTATRSFSIEVLAFDQWPGAGHYPQLTSAFVTPNHPRIAELLHAARSALAAQGEPDSLEGYQSGSRQRAARIAEACFSALASRAIGYINPPASFETAGQRIRMVDRVCRENLGTCLDLTLVLAGMWEQCGLHPLVVLTEGHAIAGVWTHEAHLPETVIDEPARLRNLIELGEVVPVEATLVTHRGATFTQAVDSAKAHLIEPGSSFAAIDVFACRKHGIRPLPLRDSGDSTQVDTEALTRRPAAHHAAVLDRVVLAERAASRQGPSGTDTQPPEPGHVRIRRWQTRLLDLSLRNRLINFRHSGRSLCLDVSALAALEDQLAAGEWLSIRPKTDADEVFRRSELQAGRVYSTEPPAETQKRLLTLYRTARSGIEETGANLLHLALGMLRWYADDGTPHLAPLVLLPVQLVRTSGGGGFAYALCLSDEPLRPNVTLLEKLRTDFGLSTTGLDELPEDDHGLDVDLILRSFREVIRDMPRWEVLDTAYLGLFSFNKFLMWRDLQENTERLKQSPLITHLIDRPGQDFDPDFITPEVRDDQVRPQDLLCTRDADSSQLAAVLAARNARSFVLEGPPGTGKSQTIANVIADSLARGKRVLFVAEKMAALSVVRSRLEADGLGAFCLELHSAKASKSEVLAQLDRALNFPRQLEPAEFETLCTQLAAARAQLNAYVTDLHTPRPSGETLYQVLGRLASLAEGPACDPPDDAGPHTGLEQLTAWRNAIKDLLDKSEPINPPGEHPLRGLRPTAWSFALPPTAQSALQLAAVALEGLRDSLASFTRACDLSPPPDTLPHTAVSMLARVAALVPTCPAPGVELLTGPASASMRAALRESIDLGRQRDSLRNQLLTRYREEFLSIEHLPHIDAVSHAARRHWPVRFFAARSARNRLRAYFLARPPSLDRLKTDLEDARTAKRLTDELAAKTAFESALGGRWKAGRADWDELDRILNWCDQFARNIEPADDATSQRCAQSLAAVLSNPAPTARAAQPARALVERWQAWQHAWQHLESTLAAEPIQPDADESWLPAVEATIARWTTGLGELNDWCTWRAARDRAHALGLHDLLLHYESGSLTRAHLSDAFERSFARTWFASTADRVPAVRTFNAHTHTGVVQRFRTLDTSLIDLTRRVVSARLAQAAPAGAGPVSAQSEIGILRRELAKKRRHMPTRRLIEAIPNLLARLKPCFLMSPLSVAQFLDTRLPAFDLVIFDEASQIPVWDAIGAIARGAQVIVVGDSKQLPPTNFFNTLDSDEDEPIEDEAVEDLESILKECNAAGVPSMRLRWHYRSRHESLIAFSNHHYYRNELHTFPSPEERSPTLGVTMRFVEGAVYDRGNTGTNRVEAEQVVAEVVGRLREPGADGSIGIVTFNQPQQTLIEDLLDAQRRADPALEPFFTGPGERVFVKNLENVQGDERDTIIFSVGYGPDADARLSMNFGPLNQDGGERRLNVAVTRARCRLIVFSSIRADQIDLKRTGAVGVRHFKAFLDYAQRGPQALADTRHTADNAGAEQFVEVVAAALESRGWKIDRRVGCAGYRIDIGVRDDDNPGRYLLGVECDGPTYHAARTARDRDRLRQSVLENLGWKLVRVWSIDWHMNPARGLDALDKAIRAARQPSAASAPDASPQPPAPASPGTTLLASESLAPPSGSVVETYRAATKPRSLRVDDIYDPRAEAALTSAIAHLVQVESPICEELVIRRLSDWLGGARVTARFRERCSHLLTLGAQAGLWTIADEAIWRPDQSPATYTTWRAPGDDASSQRDVELIPATEQRNAVMHVLHAQVALPREDLARETGKALGLSRPSPRALALLDDAIASALTAGLAEQSHDRITPARRRVME